jgi:hypothetical protein
LNDETYEKPQRNNTLVSGSSDKNGSSHAAGSPAIVGQSETLQQEKTLNLFVDNDLWISENRYPIKKAV